MHSPMIDVLQVKRESTEKNDFTHNETVRPGFAFVVQDRFRHASRSPFDPQEVLCSHRFANDLRRRSERRFYS